MAGKKGAKSVKAVEIQTRYEQNFMREMDGRCTAAKELRDDLHALAADLGGWDSLSFQEKSCCERAVHIVRHIKRDERRLALGLPVEENLHLNYINTLSGLWTKLGMPRRSKVIGTLAELLSQQESAS